jgi:hypothetical protein
MQNTAQKTDYQPLSDTISAAVDGELNIAEYQQFIADYKRDNAVQADWRTYQTIGDSLRKSNHYCNLAARISAQLAHEPTLLAPPKKSRIAHYALPVAASVAAIMFVSWSALNLNATPSLTNSVASISSPAPIQTAQIDSVQLNEFIAAHRDYAAGVNSPYMNASYATSTERQQ